MRPSTRSMTMAALLTLPLAHSAVAEEREERETKPARAARDDQADAVAELEKKTGELEKKTGELEKDVKKLKALKFAGYVQARYTQDETSAPGIKGDGKTPAGRDGFSLRRARLRVTNKTDQSEATVQFELTPSGVVMKDASMTFFEPWTPLKMGVVVGQYSMPFGFDVPRSPGKNEFMERAYMWGRLFPNEVDRGIGLKGTYKGASFDLGFVNGNGAVDTATKVYVPADVDGDGTIAEGEVKSIGTVDFTSRSADRDEKKDFYLRLGYGTDKDVVSGGVSLYQGQWGMLPALVDEDDDGDYDNGDQLIFVPKTRYGADVQLHKAFVESLGLTELRVDYVQGHGWFAADVESDTDFRGYQVSFLQGLGKRATVGVRYDAWDPDLAAEDNELTGIEPILLFPIGANGRITASYRIVGDHEGEDGADKDNNVLQIQFQGIL